MVKGRPRDSTFLSIVLGYLLIITITHSTIEFQCYSVGGGWSFFSYSQLVFFPIQFVVNLYKLMAYWKMRNVCSDNNCARKKVSLYFWGRLQNWVFPRD